MYLCSERGLHMNRVTGSCQDNQHHAVSDDAEEAVLDVVRVIVEPGKGHRYVTWAAISILIPEGRRQFAKSGSQ